DSFESFCEYCSYINNFKLIDISTLAKNIRLYFYHNAYYLVLKDISKQIDVKIFNLNISEFAEIIPFSNNFLAKLSEYGKIIIRHNAILTSTKFFIN
ncbi:MAG: adaptor protein MecA, partial [Clostridia bacterium]|nr:adaptor protein MecA [Clostridia bacterium]